MEINKSDGWKIFGAIFVIWLPVIIGLWITNLPWNIEIHIKIVYSILYSLAVSIFIYFILSRKEKISKRRSKNGKKK